MLLDKLLSTRKGVFYGFTQNTEVILMLLDKLLSTRKGGFYGFTQNTEVALQMPGPQNSNR